MRARRVDENQPAIVKALRSMGASVQPIHRLGKGVPDILVGWLRQNYLFEIKNVDGKNKITKDEQQWIQDWRGQVHVVHSLDDILAVLNGIVR